MNDAYTFKNIYKESLSNTLHALPRIKRRAINKLLTFEQSGNDGFMYRRRHFRDMYSFDWSIRRITSALLKEHYPVFEGDIAKTLFNEFTDLDEVLTGLNKNGYAISSNKLQMKLPLDGLVFKSKDKTLKPLLGETLLEAMEQNNPDKLVGTYWLDDQNTAAQMPEFARISFDPYILSVVSSYLGCTPIHVQTNVWFSFAGAQDAKTISRNAQFFHQDKEFVKFIKVFIYLNDVTEENGAHVYIAGSHKDELCQHGIPYSTRLTDEDVLQIYGADKLNIAEGTAGTVLFGDTVAAHKGMPLKTGSRLMLQLEYAASLYMSPVCPFTDISPDILPNSALYQDSPRLFANYNNEARKRFLAMPKKKLKPRKPLLRKFYERF